MKSCVRLRSCPFHQPSYLRLCSDRSHYLQCVRVCEGADAVRLSETPGSIIDANGVPGITVSAREQNQLPSTHSASTSDLTSTLLSDLLSNKKTYLQMEPFTVASKPRYNLSVQSRKEISQGTWNLKVPAGKDLKVLGTDQGTELCEYKSWVCLPSIHPYVLCMYVFFCLHLQ